MTARDERRSVERLFRLFLLLFLFFPPLQGVRRVQCVVAEQYTNLLKRTMSPDVPVADTIGDPKRTSGLTGFSASLNAMPLICTLPLSVVTKLKPSKTVALSMTHYRTSFRDLMRRAHGGGSGVSPTMDGSNAGDPQQSMDLLASKSNERKPSVCSDVVGGCEGGPVSSQSHDGIS